MEQILHHLVLVLLVSALSSRPFIKFVPLQPLGFNVASIRRVVQDFRDWRMHQHRTVSAILKRGGRRRHLNAGRELEHEECKAAHDSFHPPSQDVLFQ
jgi:hypothetical protein